ncbi:hypothetical protein FRB98_008044 [Tulasnella sp. 332]|nr:hypothetical protein FRB98_008044 [Tulasnella sp. 332]
MSREVFALDDVLIASFDLPPNGHEMWISDVSGCLSHVDLRQDKKHARRWDVNGTGQKIGCVSVNPVTPHILATASNDRTLKLWDARKLSSLPISLSSASPSPKSRKSKKEKPEEDLPAMNETEYEEISKYLESKRGPGLLRAEHPHKLSVSSAFWDPSGRRIVSTSYDDTLRVWDIKPSSLVLDTPLKKFDPVVRRNHDCQTGRWLTILKAQWMPSPEVITAVQAVAACHPSRVGRYATGNASGRCVLWAAED